MKEQTKKIFESYISILNEDKQFDIKTDLQGRPLKQQVEILWISGTTWHNAEKIAKIMNMSVTDVKAIVSSLNEDEIPGGLSDGKSLADIAKKHNVPLEDIQKQFEMGLEVEKEHTDDEQKASEITMDHLVEDYLYYTKLAKMEL